MSGSKRATIWTVGLLGIAAACLLAVTGCGDDGHGGNGTPRPTSPPASTNTPGGPAATATPTPTATPAEVAGDYAATFALDDGQEANLNLTVESDGTATGTLEIIDTGAELIRTRHAAVVQNVSVSAGLVNLSGSIDSSARTFHFSGTIDAPGGAIQFDISGTLPGSGGGGSVTLVVDGETYTSALSSGSGPTPLPTEPGATPTPADGCGGGSGNVNFSEASGVNANQPLEGVLHLAEAEGTRSMITASLFTLGGKGANCPIPVNGVVRLIDFSAGNDSELVAGTSFELGEIVIGEPYATLNYREATAAPSQQIWKAESGTFTVESVEGDTVRIRVIGAHMVPGAPFLFGPPPLGTFTLDAVLTIDHVTMPG